MSVPSKPVNSMSIEIKKRFSILSFLFGVVIASSTILAFDLGLHTMMFDSSPQKVTLPEKEESRAEKMIKEGVVRRKAHIEQSIKDRYESLLSDIRNHLVYHPDREYYKCIYNENGTRAFELAKKLKQMLIQDGFSVSDDSRTGCFKVNLK